MTTTTVTPYDICPVYEGERFTFRLVEKSDAEDLLCCYSDEKAAALFNSDNCTSDFKYKNLEEMSVCIRFWLSEYSKKRFIRLCIINRQSGKGIGTIEIFNKGTFDNVSNVGILRIDLLTGYEREDYLEEIIGTIDKHFYHDFSLDNIMTKAFPNAVQRIAVLKQEGYLPIEGKNIMPYDDYYIRPLNPITIKQVTDSIGYCGLICTFCHEAFHCGGCKSEKNCCGRYMSDSGCYHYNCCKEKGINGCWECDIGPCDIDMFSEHHDLRNRTFVKCAKQEGIEKLAAYVLSNQKNGIRYGWNLDYDNLGSEEAVMDLLHNGVSRNEVK